MFYHHLLFYEQQNFSHLFATHMEDRKLHICTLVVVFQNDTNASMSACGGWFSSHMQSKHVACNVAFRSCTRACSHVLPAPRVIPLTSDCTSRCAVYKTSISTCAHACKWMPHTIFMSYHSYAKKLCYLS